MLDLTARQYHILEIVIIEYLKNQKEVSSLHISQTYPLNVSSATLRNEFGVLTRKGYLQKVHHASGRLPTIKALRVFIQNLKPTPNITILRLLHTLYDLTTNNIWDAILSVLTKLLDGIVFISTPKQLIIKNTYAFILQLKKKLGVTAILDIVTALLKYIDHPSTFYFLLQQTYMNETINNITLTALDATSRHNIPHPLIVFSPFKYRESSGFLGIITFPSLELINKANIIKELSNILTTL